jgi:hypothetical protein
MSDAESILSLLLAKQKPEDQARLRVAWERYAKGDPDSLPALYALADRFSLHAHAALLDEQKKLTSTTRLWTYTAAACLCGLMAGIALCGYWLKSSGQAALHESGASMLCYQTGGQQVIELVTPTTPKAYVSEQGRGIVVFERHEKE